MGTWESSRKSWRKMAFLLSPSVLGLAAVAGLVIYLLFFSKPKLPPGTKKLPGPKGIPLLGSVPDLPAKHSWLQRAQTKARIESGKDTQEYSWTRGSLKDASLQDEEKAYCVGMMTLIASVLESSPIQGWVVAMAMYPEWQKKAQDEVDAVCGERMPTSEDIQKLPIVRALIRETFRWRSPVPFGVPHMLTEDDVYEGYHIEKGSVVFALECAMSRDEALYPDPENYRPERWLDPAFPTYKEPLTHYPSLKNHSAFGWGRRQCLGLDYTEIVHVTLVASILWSCSIQKKIDPQTGEETELPWMDYTPFVIVRPMPTKLDIVPRSQERIRLLSPDTCAA